MEEIEIIELLEYRFPDGPDAPYRGGRSPEVVYCELMRPDKEVLHERACVYGSHYNPKFHKDLRDEYEILREQYAVIEANWRKLRSKLWLKRFPFYIVAVIIIGSLTWLLLFNVVNTNLQPGEQSDLGGIVIEGILKYVFVMGMIGIACVVCFIAMQVSRDKIQIVKVIPS